MDRCGGREVGVRIAVLIYVSCVLLRIIRYSCVVVQRRV